MAEYSRIVEGDRDPDGSGADSGRAATPSYGELFGPVETARFPGRSELDLPHVTIAYRRAALSVLPA